MTMTEGPVKFLGSDSGSAEDRNMRTARKFTFVRLGYHLSAARFNIIYLAAISCHSISVTVENPRVWKRNHA